MTSPVFGSVIAGQSVFVERTFSDGRRRDHSSHVDVSQAVSEIVDVDLNPNKKDSKKLVPFINRKNMHYSLIGASF